MSLLDKLRNNPSIILLVVIFSFILFSFSLSTVSPTPIIVIKSPTNNMYPVGYQSSNTYFIPLSFVVSTDPANLQAVTVDYRFSITDDFINIVDQQTISSNTYYVDCLAYIKFPSDIDKVSTFYLYLKFTIITQDNKTQLTNIKETFSLNPDSISDSSFTDDTVISFDQLSTKYHTPIDVPFLSIPLFLLSIIFYSFIKGDNHA